MEKWYLYANDFGVARDRLHFPEPLPSVEKVLQWLDGCDAFVLPTRSEGLSRCVVEAMSRGCPCFATNICTMPELLPEECLFELDDDKELAELLLKYTADKSLMKKLAQINFEHVRDYDVEILKERRKAFLAEFKEYCESYKK